MAIQRRKRLQWKQNRQRRRKLPVESCSRSGGESRKNGTGPSGLRSTLVVRTTWTGARRSWFLERPSCFAASRFSPCSPPPARKSGCRTGGRNPVWGDRKAQRNRRGIPDPQSRFSVPTKAPVIRLHPILKIPLSIDDDVFVTRIAEIVFDALPLAAADDLHLNLRVWASKNHVASSLISRSHTVPTDHDLVRLLQRCACLIPKAVEKELPLVPERCTVKELLVSTGKNQTRESSPARIDMS